jgi:hypothetical protein
MYVFAILIYTKYQVSTRVNYEVIYGEMLILWNTI